MPDTDKKDELLEFAEKSAEQLMKHHLEDMAIINREANVTFTFAIGALSVTFGYLVQIYNTQPGAIQQWSRLVPVFILTIHLIACAAWVLMKTMLFQEVMPLGNEPKNLLSEELRAADFNEVRLAECLNQQARIEFNRTRNKRTAKELNRVRKALVAAPAIFLAVWAVTALVLGLAGAYR